MWSVIESEYKLKIDKKYRWIKELHFYIGDLSQDNIDFKTDWRFKEISGKRKQNKFLGTVETEFPIKFPLKLNNGLILEDIYFKKNIIEEY